MIRKIFLALALIGALLSTAVVSAQEQPVVNIYLWQTDGTVLSVPYATLDSIGFYLPAPEVVTSETVAGITYYSAICGGEASGHLITSCGICYSTEPQPEVSDANDKVAEAEKAEAGQYTITIAGLDSETSYYIRAYATNASGTVYGSEQSFTTLAKPETPASGGKLPGAFSVSATKQVQFSQGNLMYCASTNTWRFAEHQWDFVGSGKDGDGSSETNKITGTIEGSNNGSIGQEGYNGWIDLFGWGTGNNPTLSSTTSIDYATFTDWGANPIANGGNQANQWRTLTYDECYYLMNTRTDADQKYGVAKVNGVTGVIFLPDDWALPENITFAPGVDQIANWVSYESLNNYTLEQWQLMESAGAVFMPAAGYRSGTDVDYVGLHGYYWSSSDYGANLAYYLYFDSGDVGMYNFSSYRNYGRSVRPVSEFQATE